MRAAELRLVLREGLLAQIPGLSVTEAERVAAALAYDVSSAGMYDRDPRGGYRGADMPVGLAPPDWHYPELPDPSPPTVLNPGITETGRHRVPHIPVPSGRSRRRLVVGLLCVAAGALLIAAVAVGLLIAG